MSTTRTNGQPLWEQSAFSTEPYSPPTWDLLKARMSTCRFSQKANDLVTSFLSEGDVSHISVKECCAHLPPSLPHHPPWLTPHLPGNTTVAHTKIPVFFTSPCEIGLTFTQQCVSAGVQASTYYSLLFNASGPFILNGFMCCGWLGVRL